MTACGIAALRSSRSGLRKRFRPTRWCGLRFVSDRASHWTSPSAERDDALARQTHVTVTGAVVNVGLCVAKGTAGIAGNSVALLVDAAHSLSDLVSDGVTLWAVQLSRKPPDEEHPWGHGRFETIGALSVSAMLVVAGAGMGFHSYEALSHVMEPSLVTVQSFISGKAIESTSAVDAAAATPTALALAAVAVSLMSKEALFRWTARVGKETNSQVLLANAWHHRTDALSSLVAAFGIAGAMNGLPMLDPLAGLLVAAMIVKAGGEIGYDALHELSDISVHKSVVVDLKSAIAATSGVLGVPHVRARMSGPYMFVDTVVSVDQRTSISAADDVAARVRAAVKSAKLGADVAEVLVHVEPHFTARSPESKGAATRRPQQLIEADVRTLLSRLRGVQSVEHVTLHLLATGLEVEVVIALDPALRISDAHSIAKRARLVLQDEARPRFEYTPARNKLQHSVFDAR